MNQGKLAQARRFYHHVVNGGELKPEDVSYMVSALEEAYENIAVTEERIVHLETTLDTVDAALGCWRRVSDGNTSITKRIG